MIALFWDIDGTLLTTARAGVFSLEDALERVSGVRASLQEAATAGLTDYAIAESALRSVGHRADEPSVHEFLRIHGEQLASYLGRRQGHLLPGVREVLDDLDGRDDVLNLLLTGNVEAGAWAKLSHYGISQYFRSGGAFCVGPGSRAEIARSALERIDGAEAVFVVGDTPHDVAAATSIGAHAIAVATGTYTTEQLVQHRPWAVLERIPEPPAFRELVGLDR